eukprot:CAMPEP_0117426390 /NCGR_PEP_ID=MMETSP0758-20121206/6520_1 /TAXON_ID=63605 /ORGANISM="Percolomonas cosmopolitus, Strain AE-1 (ATCC 50343)" /LENGTH=107 /DNA_ID=CAMNT_0005211543 /DNA_START=851 /DNA_END=1170 /DNA_ORIENTATION=+
MEDCHENMNRLKEMLKAMLEAWEYILSSQEQLKGMILVFSYFITELEDISPLLVERWQELETHLENTIHDIEYGTKMKTIIKDPALEKLEREYSSISKKEKKTKQPV